MTLQLANLPEYALRTTMRMFMALAASLVFTLVIATLAAKVRRGAVMRKMKADSLAELVKLSERLKEGDR